MADKTMAELIVKILNDVIPMIGRLINPTAKEVKKGTSNKISSCLFFRRLGMT